MEGLSRRGGTGPLVLNLGTTWGYWSASRPSFFIIRRQPKLLIE